MPSGSPEPYVALILAGGRATRLGGADKTALVVGGLTMLERVRAAVAAASDVVVVGREQGGGPVAAIAAGLSRAAGTLGGTVVVLAADLPFVTPDVVRALQSRLAAEPGAAVALLVDGSGRDQYLCAAWRAVALRSALSALGPPDGRAVRDLVAAAGPVARVGAGSPPFASPPPWLDCDTPADLDAARRWAAGAGREPRHTDGMDEWIDRVCAELGIADVVDRDVARDLVLGVAREVAHRVERPAAPVTAFLLGVAAGRSGDPRGSVADQAAAILRLLGEDQLGGSQ